MQPTLQKKFCLLNFVTGLCLLILLVGCGKKSETTTETPAGGAQPGAPTAPNKPVPSFSASAEIQAAQEQGAASAPQKKGGRAKGAAKGAVGGAVNGCADTRLVSVAGCLRPAKKRSDYDR